MILTTHAIIGAAIANAFPYEPHIGLPLSLASHYIIDILPHTNYGHEHFQNENNRDAIIDFHNIDALVQIFFTVLDITVAVLLVFLLFVRDKQTFFLSVFGAMFAVLPDIFNFFSYKFGGRFFTGAKKLHDLFHYNKDFNHNYFYGVMTQLAVVVFMVIVSFLAVSVNP